MSIHAFLGFHIHILELQLTFNYHLHLNRGRHEISFTENQYIFLQMKFDWKTFFFFIPLQNDDLKKLVKKILDGANLEQVTMKTVVKQVNKLFDNTDRNQN
jgi:hypothetical protein